MSTAGFLASIGVLGVLVGSFVNVVARRVPAGESLGGRSHCPSCGMTLSARDLVPIVSWMTLRARCRGCGAAISWKYPVVELLCGGLFAGLAAHFGQTAALPAYLVLAAGLLALSVVDLETFRLPNLIVGPLTALVVVGLGAAATVDGNPDRFLRALAAGAAATVALGTLHLISPAGMGFGDVKLAFVLGLATGWVSWEAMAVGFFLACALGAVVGILLGTVLGGPIRKRRVPFGPFLAAGALAAVFAAPSLVDWYRHLG